MARRVRHLEFFSPSRFSVLSAAELSFFLVHFWLPKYTWPKKHGQSTVNGTVKNFLRHILKVDIHEFFQYIDFGHLNIQIILEWQILKPI